jgi:hypothetical protein
VRSTAHTAESAQLLVAPGEGPALVRGSRKLFAMSSVAAGLEPIAPISEPQRQALHEAEAAARRLAFAPKLATWNGVSMLLGAAVSLCLAFFDHGLILSAAVLGLCGYIELSAGKRLRDYDERAPLRLALNQVVLLALVVGYSILKLMAAWTGHVSLAAELAQHPELAAMLEQLEDPSVRETFESFGEMYRWGVVGLYSAVIVIALVVQGGAAAYYLSRRKHLRAFLASTPEWVVDFMRRKL